MEQFQQLFGLTARTRVLDVGGSCFNWSLLRIKPRLTIVNLYPQAAVGAQVIRADGCRLPFADQSFDIVYSNSVIEHLADLAHVDRMAREIRRVGRRYYVQTPNRSFPIEPHYLAPMVHYLPAAWQRRLVGRLSGWALIARPTQGQIDALVDEIVLLSRRQMVALFPEAEVIDERIFGLSKSLIAING
jgi:SAM-dependent methyltransferase